MRGILIGLMGLLAAVATMPVSAADDGRPVRALIITGDNVGVHDWPGTTKALVETLVEKGKVDVDVTAAPSKDLTDENLSKYDVLVLNYRDTPQGSPESRWSDANKEAFLKAVKGGKGLVVVHYASAAFTSPNWAEFEKAIAGGWRSQGYHGPAHEFTVKRTPVQHPISEGLPNEFAHVKDELYSASMRTRDSLVLATAYCDPSKPQGTGADEPVVWVNKYGQGRVYNNVLGHDVAAIKDPNVQRWLRRGVVWAATGTVPSAKP